MILKVDSIPKEGNRGHSFELVKNPCRVCYEEEIRTEKLFHLFTKKFHWAAGIIQLNHLFSN